MAIGGPTDTTPQVNAGISAQPLVTSADTSVVGPAAVEQLVDSLRKGVITHQDIIDRIGSVGQAKKKAILESLGEYVNPDVINSRLNAARAADAQAQLATQQAQAQQSMVQQQTDVAKTQLSSAQAQAVYGQTGLDTFQQFGQYFGKALPPNPTVDDFKEAAAEGNKMRGQLALTDQWIKMLTGTDKEIEENGVKTMHRFNGLGQDVSPPNPETGYPGSPYYQAYVQHLYDVMPEFHPAHGQFLNPKLVPDKTSAGEAHLVKPASALNTNSGEDRAKLVAILDAKGFKGPDGNPIGASALNELSNEQVQDMMDQQAPAPSLVAPANAPSPATAKPVPAGIVTYRPNPLDVKSKILTDTRGDKRVTNWEAAQQYINPFVQRAQEVAKMPIEQQQSDNMAVIDQGMVENLIKMYDPQGTMREFKWEKTEQNQSRLEKYLNMKNVWQRVKGETVLTPQARQRLIDMGYEAIRGVESAAQPAFQNAIQSANTAGIANPLDSEQNRVAQGNFAQNPWPLSRGAAKGLVQSPAASGPGQVKFIPGVGNVQRGADGKFYKVD